MRADAGARAPSRPARRRPGRRPGPRPSTRRRRRLVRDRRSRRRRQAGVDHRGAPWPSPPRRSRRTTGRAARGPPASCPSAGTSIQAASPCSHVWMVGNTRVVALEVGQPQRELEDVAVALGERGVGPVGHGGDAFGDLTAVAVGDRRVELLQRLRPPPTAAWRVGVTETISSGIWTVTPVVDEPCAPVRDAHLEHGVGAGRRGGRRDRDVGAGRRGRHRHQRADGGADGAQPRDESPPLGAPRHPASWTGPHLDAEPGVSPVTPPLNQPAELCQGCEPATHC